MIPANEEKTMKKAKLIYNPFSGDGAILNCLDKIFEIYQKNGFILDIFRLSYEADYFMILQNIHEYDHFLISGGDGTINHIVNIIKKSEIDIPIGILPYGTANDFATFINIPKNIQSACEQIINSKPKSVDIGLINDQYFINVASIGVFSDISHNTNSVLKKNLGNAAYFLNAITELPKVKKAKISIEIDGFKLEDEIIAMLIFNGKTAGNLNLASEANLFDGLFNIILIRSSNILDVANMLKNIIIKHKFDSGASGVSCFRASDIRVELLSQKHLETDLDGEKGPEFPLSIKCIQGGLKILGII